MEGRLEYMKLLYEASNFYDTSKMGHSICYFRNYRSITALMFTETIFLSC